MKTKVKRCLSSVLIIFIWLSIFPQIVNAENANDRQQAIYNYLTKDLGFNIAVACGFISNMSEENGIFEPNRNQIGMADGTGGYGILQWEGSRRTRLQTWCGNNGYSYSTLIGQLAYLEYELSIYKYNGSNLLQWFKGSNYTNDANGAYESAKFICTDYVGPKNAASKALVRGKLAQESFYPQYSADNKMQTPTYTTPTCTTGEVTANGHTITLRITIDSYGSDEKVNKIGWFIRESNGNTVLHEPIKVGTFSKISDGGNEYTTTIEVTDTGEYVVRAYAETVYGRGQAMNISQVNVVDPPTCTTGNVIVNGNSLTLRASIDTYGGDAKVNKIGWFVRKADSSIVLYEPTISGTFSKLTDGGSEYSYKIDNVEPGEYIIRAYAETIYGRGQASNTKKATVTTTQSSNEIVDNADLTGFTLYIPESYTEYNDEITVPIKISNNTGISNFGFTLLYDSNSLKPVSVDNGSVWTPELASNMEYGEGQIFISSSTDSNKTADGTIVEVTFKITREVGQLNFDIEVDNFGKINANNKLSSFLPNVKSGSIIFNIDKSDYILGDVNGDGKIDSGDATIVLLHYAKIKILDNELMADVNRDGKVDSGDATLILLHYAKLKLIEN